MRTRRQKRERWWALPLLALGLAALLNRFVLINARVPSGSMEPAIPSGAMVLGDRTAYLRADPQVGDVVFFRHEEEFGRDILIKRVAAVGGQVFSVRDGQAYLDGLPLAQGRSPVLAGTDFPDTAVPEDCLVVLGDNREASNDSRYWADPFVPRQDVLGRAVLVYFPGFHLL